MSSDDGGEPECGNGQLDSGESCDLGSENDDAGICTTVCQQARCGDGLLGPGESCDDGGTQDGDGCSSTCVLETCGDGVVDEGEACDDANTADDDACTSACTVAVCGDGYVQPANGEDCDDGNAISRDGCEVGCRLSGGVAWSWTKNLIARPHEADLLGGGMDAAGNVYGCFTTSYYDGGVKSGETTVFQTLADGSPGWTFTSEFGATDSYGCAVSEAAVTFVYRDEAEQIAAGDASFHVARLGTTGKLSWDAVVTHNGGRPQSVYVTGDGHTHVLCEAPATFGYGHQLIELDGTGNELAREGLDFGHFTIGKDRSRAWSNDGASLNVQDSTGSSTWTVPVSSVVLPTIDENGDVFALGFAGTGNFVERYSAAGTLIYRTELSFSEQAYGPWPATTPTLIPDGMGGAQLFSYARHPAVSWNDVYVHQWVVDATGAETASNFLDPAIPTTLLGSTSLQNAIYGGYDTNAQRTGIVFDRLDFDATDGWPGVYQPTMAGIANGAVTWLSARSLHEKFPDQLTRAVRSSSGNYIAIAEKDSTPRDCQLVEISATGTILNQPTDLQTTCTGGILGASDGDEMYVIADGGTIALGRLFRVESDLSLTNQGQLTTPPGLGDLTRLDMRTAAGRNYVLVEEDTGASSEPSYVVVVAELPTSSSGSWHVEIPKIAVLEDSGDVVGFSEAAVAGWSNFLHRAKPTGAFTWEVPLDLEGYVGAYNTPLDVVVGPSGELVVLVALVASGVDKLAAVHVDPDDGEFTRIDVVEGEFLGSDYLGAGIDLGGYLTTVWRTPDDGVTGEDQIVKQVFLPNGEMGYVAAYPAPVDVEVPRGSRVAVQDDGSVLVVGGTVVDPRLDSTAMMLLP